MAIIVEKTPDWYAKNYPAMKLYIPMKEQRNGVVEDPPILTDYASGESYTGLFDAFNLATNDAIGPQIASDLEILTYSGGIGERIVVGANQNFIAVAVGNGMNDADADFQIGCEGGTKTNKSINICKAGAMGIDHDVLGAVTGGSPLGGNALHFVGLDRSTDEAVFGGINSSGLTSTPARIDASAYSGEILNFGGVAADDTGLFWQQAGAGTLLMYNVAVCVFTGSFPDITANSVVDLSLKEWRTGALAGEKFPPGFMKDLSP